jgi:hypothetical protein
MSTIILFLLLGAIANVAVAWGVLFVYCTPDQTSLSSAQARRIWDGLPLPWAISGTAWGNEHRQYGWRLSFLGTEPLGSRGARVTTSGFPCNCFQAVYAYWSGQYVRTGWQHPDLWPLPEIEVLPTSILWPGFAINTLFYAAVLWLLFAAPFALRRRLVIRRRIKRGLCPKCAYDLRAAQSNTCPECGATR